MQRYEVIAMTTETLQEYCDSRGAAIKIDREHGVIEGVKILGLSSRNGRTYTKEAVAKSIRLYEGSKVNVNHPNGNPNGPRDYRDRIGSIRGVAMREGDGLYGNLHFNPKHALAEQLLWDAEHSPENVGFSHNVEARTSRGKSGVVIEEIVRVHSVDLVADPATTRGLFEGINQEGEDTLEIKDITEAMLRADRPELVESIGAAALAAFADSEAGKAKNAQLAALTEEVKTLKEAAGKAALEKTIAAELAEAKLPLAVAELIKPQLFAADVAGRKTILEQAISAAKSLGGSKATSKEQRITEGDGNVGTVTNGKTLAAAIME
jgi:hypothetical protein